MSTVSKLNMTMTMVAGFMAPEQAYAHIDYEYQQVPVEIAAPLGALAIYDVVPPKDLIIMVPAPEQVQQTPPAETTLPPEVSASKVLQPLQLESFQAQIAPPTSKSDTLQAGTEAIDPNTIDLIVSTINESVDPNKLYQIDPALLKDTASFLLHQGFSIQGTSAALGALMTEHKLNTDGDGIVQWTGGRKERINPQDTDTVPEQLMKMINEMKEYYPTVYDDLCNTRLTLQQAINAMQRYEGAGILGRRGEFSRTIFSLLQDGRAMVIVLPK